MVRIRTLYLICFEVLKGHIFYCKKYRKTLPTLAKENIIKYVSNEKKPSFLQNECASFSLWSDMRSIFLSTLESGGGKGV